MALSVKYSFNQATWDNVPLYCCLHKNESMQNEEHMYWTIIFNAQTMFQSKLLNEDIKRWESSQYEDKSQTWHALIQSTVKEDNSNGLRCQIKLDGKKLLFRWFLYFAELGAEQTLGQIDLFQLKSDEIDQTFKNVFKASMNDVQDLKNEKISCLKKIEYYKNENQETRDILRAATLSRDITTDTLLINFQAILNRKKAKIKVLMGAVDTMKDEIETLKSQIRTTELQKSLNASMDPFSDETQLTKADTSLASLSQDSYSNFSLSQSDMADNTQAARIPSRRPRLLPSRKKIMVPVNNSDVAKSDTGHVADNTSQNPKLTRDNFETGNSMDIDGME